MAKDVNLTSQEWCDIVFEGKNKEYGAYKIRRTSSKRHTIALITIFIVAIFIAALPTLIAKVAEAVAKRNIAEGLTDKTVLADLEEIKEDEVIPPQNEEPPPPPLKATIMFTPPVMVDKEELNEENTMKSIDELNDAKVQISIATVEGTEGATIDIADLKEKNKITQEEENKIHTSVDQMPEYPGGGLPEFYNYLNKQIDYPAQARDYGIQGTSVIQFAVMKDGTVDKVTVHVSSHSLLDKEAVRVIKSSPKWIPGKINGKPVNCYYIIPVRFTLQ